MNPDEYRRLDWLEKEHWFYAGKREIVRYWIEKLHPLSVKSLLVDCGAGTGQFAAEMQKICHILAVDDHDESLDIATSKLGPLSVKRGSCLALPLPDESADCVTALDVLEHVHDDVAAIAEFARVLKPGGIAVVTVPALQGLWSDWDISLHHCRRYGKQSFLKLLNQRDFTIEHWNFINVLALPVVYLARRFRSLGSTRAEDVMPPHWLNSTLKSAFTFLACQSRIHFPAGVGLLAIVRKNRSR